MKLHAWFGLTAFGIVIAACRPSIEDVRYTSEEVAAIELPVAAPAPARFAQVVPTGPRLIRSGSARLEVENLDAALTVAHQMAAAVEGYVAGSNLNEGREGARTASLVLRVPSDSLDSVIERLSDIGRLLSLSVDATDVSREYFDVETRLAVKEETVTRLRQLAERSGDLEDVLAAERELGRAVAELEGLRGQLRYYDQRLSESDLRVSLIEPGAVVTSGAFRPVLDAFRGATEVFAESVAYIVYLLVFLAPWLLLALLLWPAFTRWRRMRGEQATMKGA